MTGDPERARDLVQETLRRAMDPNGQMWDPARRPDLMQHLRTVLNSLKFNQDRRREEHGEIAGGIGYTDDVAHPTQAPEELVSLKQDAVRFEKHLEDVTKYLEDDPITLRIIALARDGVETNKELADHLACSVNDVAIAKKRIKRQLEKVQQAERSARARATERRGSITVKKEAQ